MTDAILLQINHERRLIPEDRVKEAIEVQERERDSGAAPRPLLDILRAQGAITDETAHQLRALLHDSLQRQPTLHLPPPGNGDETTLIDLPPLEPAVQPVPVTTAACPPEVVLAGADPKKRFGQFVLVAQVGSGGSGTVFRAWDLKVARYAGLKILHTLEPSALERFTREARISGNLQHPSIATIYEVGEHTGRSYIAMTYIDGAPIDAVPRSIPHNLGLIRDACRALEYAHAKGIVHRDIKPANLLVDRENHVYVTDFGIAKQIHHDQTSAISMTGTILGTPKYLPPEQARGEAKLADARSDVYSMGATLYTLLAGQAPFPSASIWETIESVMKHDPPPLRSLNGAVSPELERVVGKSMAKDPAHRFPTAGAMADELERLIVERRYTGRYGLARFLTRKWLPVAVVGAILAFLVEPAAPIFSSKATSEEPRDKSSAELYDTAASELRNIERNPQAEVRRKEVGALLDGALKKLLSRDPGHANGLVLRARAYFIAGELDKARMDLERWNSTPPPDYRVGYLRALLALQRDLLQPPPLPAPEAPYEDWDGPVPPFTKGLAEAFQMVQDASTPELLREDHRRDAGAAGAFGLLTSGQWKAAADKLKEHMNRDHVEKLPVFQAAWCRAAYLQRDFGSVVQDPDSKDTRERFGANLGLALALQRPDAWLKNLEDSWSSEALGKLTVLAWKARRAFDLGRNPGPEVLQGLSVNLPGEKAVVELHGVLEVAGLRWKALSADDSEKDYEQVLARLGPQPAGWMGRLATMEALVGLGTLRKLRGGDYQTPLKGAIALADGFLKDSDWSAARVLRAQANMRLGDFEAVLIDLDRIRGPSMVEDRADLVKAAVYLRMAKRDRDRGLPYDTLLTKVREAAGPILRRLQKHPEALNLNAAAAVFMAETELDAVKLQEAVQELDGALAEAPGYVSALFHRASALHLLSLAGASADPSKEPLKEQALESLDAVLKAIPELVPARELRGIIHFSMGRYDKAIEDWSPALERAEGTERDRIKKCIDEANALRGK